MENTLIVVASNTEMVGCIGNLVKSTYQQALRDMLNLSLMPTYLVIVESLILQIQQQSSEKANGLCDKGQIHAIYHVIEKFHPNFYLDNVALKVVESLWDSGQTMFLPCLEDLPPLKEQAPELYSSASPDLTDSTSGEP